MSQGGFGVSADRRICSLDAHPLHIGILVVGYDDGNLDWRNADNGDFMKVGATDGSKAEIVRWAPKESLTVACVFGDRASVFDRTGNAWRSFILRGHASDVLSISWSSDGMKLATSSVDNKIIYWDYLRGAQLQVISASGWITSCAIDPASRYIAGCVDDKLMVWRIADGIEHFSARVNRRTGGKAKCVEWSPDGKNVCCGSSDGSVTLFDRQNESPPVFFEGFGSEPISRVRFCPSVGKDPHSSSNGSTPSSYLCVCSKSNIVIFSSQNAEALDNWSVRECDDISWTPRGEVIYCARGDEPFMMRKPTALANLEFVSAHQILESVVGGHSMRGNDTAKPGGDAFIESVVQMETEELGKQIAFKQQQQQQLANQRFGLSQANASNAPSQQSQQQQSVTTTKAGKKRIQPINASASNPVIPSLNGPASSAPPTAVVSNGLPPPPPPPPSSVSKSDGISLPPPPPPPPLPSSSSSAAAASSDNILSTNGTSSSTTIPQVTTSSNHTTTTTSSTTTSAMNHHNISGGGGGGGAASTLVQMDPGDCGKCKNCLDKPKFGGRNVLKQRCIHRPPMAKRAKTGLPQASSLDANKNHLFADEMVDEDVVIGGAAESDEDDGWSSSELEPDSDNEYSAFVLNPLRMSEFYDSANVVRSLSRERQLRMEQKQFNRMDISLFESGERRWTTTVRGVVVALVHSQEFICCATSAKELHVFDAASGVIIGPPLALNCACAYLELISPSTHLNNQGESLLVFCTKDGNVNMLNLHTDEMLIAQAPLSPLLTLRGKPFSLASTTSSSSPVNLASSQKPKLCSIHVMQNRNLVLLVSDRAEISCAAFAYQPKHKSWTKILDPMRFIGSEFMQIYPSNSSSVAKFGGLGGQTTELATVQQKLIWGLASASSASMAASLLGETGTVSLQITVAHVESMIHACRTVECKNEEKEWLQILFDRLARDFQGFNRKAKQWLVLVNDKLALDKHFINQNLLPRLAKNRDYQNLVEFWVERSS